MSARRDRGEGSVFRAGKRWRVRVRYTRPGDVSPKQGLLQQTYRTKKEALEKLPDLKERAARLELLPEKAIEREKQSLAVYLKEWHASRVRTRRIQPTTIRNEALCIDRITKGLQDDKGNAIPGLGRIKLNQLTVYSIDAWFDQLTAFWHDKPDSHLAMRRRIFATLRKALNDAKLGHRNPILGADSPRSTSDRDDDRQPSAFSQQQLRCPGTRSFPR